MANKVLITGSAGLVGSEAVKFYSQKGFKVFGVDNNLREYFFGKEGSNENIKNDLLKKFPDYQHYDIDVRDDEKIKEIFNRYGKFGIIIHAAAQPSHDWAAREPYTDFTINANGTLVMLENFRKHSPDAVFIYTSTNKVYGDSPNSLELSEESTRYELNKKHKYHMFGIDESMSIDDSKHSIMGASKLAADILCQEYAKYFGLKVGIFRCGCITGPGQSGAMLHGFLSYLVKCIITGKKYNIIGYKGKQVRDNIHSYDLVNAFDYFSKKPLSGVYNMGGSRHSNISIIEAISKIENISGKKASYEIVEEARIGDHVWYISDVRKFRKNYPEWDYKYDMDAILKELVESFSKTE